MLKENKLKNRLSYNDKELIKVDKDSGIALVKFIKTEKYGTFIIGVDGLTLTNGMWFNELTDNE